MARPRPRRRRRRLRRAGAVARRRRPRRADGGARARRHALADGAAAPRARRGRAPDRRRRRGVRGAEGAPLDGDRRARGGYGVSGGGGTGARGPRARGGGPGEGALLTVAAVVESAAQKARLWMETGALAVDMESAAVMAWARERSVPAAVVRAVSDDAESSISTALAGAAGEDGRVRPLRAVTAALTRQTSVNALLGLRAGTEAALKSVAAALATLARGA